MLKAIDEEYLDGNIEGYKFVRDGWKKGTPNYECYDLVVREYEKLKSKLVDLPDSSGEEQDGLWKQLYEVVNAYHYNYISVSTTEELKQRFTIKKK